MDKFDEIKNLWQSHKIEKTPSVTSIKNAIKNYHSKKKRNIIFIILFFIFSIFVWIGVMINYKSHLWTTRFGEMLFIVLTIYLIFIKLKLLKKKQQEELLSTNDYLNELKKKSQKEAQDQSKLIIFLIASVSLFLYTYEMFSYSKIRLIIGYSTLLLYFVFIWFIYRPMMLKRQQKKVQNLLNKIDTIKNQTNEKEY